jgi:ATP-dependent DNA helicase RecG
LYDDSFSVWNDGGLPEGISEEDLKKVHRSKPRNPLLADVCFKAGYIDSWGRGTIKIIEACQNVGLPEPILKEEQGGFLSMIFKSTEKVRRKDIEVTEETKGPLSVFRDKYGESTEKVRRKYGENAEKILASMYVNPDITTSEIAKSIDKSQSTIEKAIKKLKKAKLVDRIGSDRSGYWKVTI